MNAPAAVFTPTMLDAIYIIQHDVMLQQEYGRTGLGVKHTSLNPGQHDHHGVTKPDQPITRDDIKQPNHPHEVLAVQR